MPNVRTDQELQLIREALTKGTVRSSYCISGPGAGPFCCFKLKPTVWGLKLVSQTTERDVDLVSGSSSSNYCSWAASKF